MAASTLANSFIGRESIHRSTYGSNSTEHKISRMISPCWMEPDKVLDLVALAAVGKGWSDVPASQLFAELLSEPGPGPMGGE